MTTQRASALMSSFCSGVLCVVLMTALTSATRAEEANPRVQITTSMGAVTVELYPRRAPLTVENFLGYVDSGFYEGLAFHRVIEGFMVQTGGYDAESGGQWSSGRRWRFAGLHGIRPRHRRHGRDRRHRRGPHGHARRHVRRPGRACGHYRGRAHRGRLNAAATLRPHTPPRRDDRQ